MTPDNKLRKLNLRHNPIDDGYTGSDSNDDDVTKDPMEIAALVTLLDTFNGISNLGSHCFDGKYEPEIEYALRINQAGRKELMGGGRSSRGALNADNEDKPIMNRALWPLILERAYNISSRIYDYEEDTASEQVESKKCASGLFHLVRNFYARVMVEDRAGTNTSTSTSTFSSTDDANLTKFTKIANYNSSKGGNNTNTRNERKGKGKRKR
jgi:hypothetical protein